MIFRVKNKLIEIKDEQTLELQYSMSQEVIWFPKDTVRNTNTWQHSALGMVFHALRRGFPFGTILRTLSATAYLIFPPYSAAILGTGTLYPRPENASSGLFQGSLSVSSESEPGSERLQHVKQPYNYRRVDNIIFYVPPACKLVFTLQLRVA